MLHVWLAYTPSDKAQRTNRTFGYLSVKRPKMPGLIQAAWPFITWFTESIFKEDKHIVEQEQIAHDIQGGDWNNEVFPAIRDLRALLMRCGLSVSFDGHEPVKRRRREEVDERSASAVGASRTA